MTTKTEFRLLVDGQLVPGADAFDVINPATEQILARCPRADSAQLDRAVAAAKRAFPSWAGRSIEERGTLLHRLAAAVNDRAPEFARLLTQEQGKPRVQAVAEVAGSVAMIHAFADMDLPVKVLKDSSSCKILEQRTPLGVVVAITPWNFPLLLLAVKIAPALLAGNTVIAKPAPTTPLTTLRLGELAGAIFPPGVVGVITDMNDLGDSISSHPDVAKVAFTGSTATGRKVMANAASTLKRLTLELGGNDAAIVLDDVNVPQVAKRIFAGAMVNSGQVCLAIKRVYAHKAIYDEFCGELVKLANTAVVGDGLAVGTDLGPLQNKRQFERVREFIEDGRTHGKIIAGGNVLERPGYFVAPTIVRDIGDDARLVREEQFGPVLPVLRFRDTEEVIARANDSPYGLGATVWCSSGERGLEIAKRLEAGTVWVNKHLDFAPDIPYGGTKQSGFGAELGREGLEEFTQTKIINVSRESL